MITVINAASILKNKVGKETEDVSKVWDAFKSFCKEPAEDEIEILFQCGVYDFTGEDLFYYDFVRQFPIYEGDKYSHMEQLHCEFKFPPTSELTDLEVSEWFFKIEGGDIDVFFIKSKILESLKYR